MSDHCRARVVRVRVDKHGASLATAAAVGATSLSVRDAGDLPAEGGSLLVDDDTAATLDYTSVTFVEDADASDLTTADTITLSAPLASAIDSGTQVFVWDDDEVVADYIAVCIPEDDEDEAETGDPIRATIPPHLQDDLPPGRQPGLGVRAVLEFDDDADEWTVKRFRGSSRGVRFEADDAYTITAADVTAATVTIPLSQQPISESLKLWWRTTFQPPTEYVVDEAAQTVTMPLGSFVAAGDVISVHYAYRKGLASPRLWVPIGATWKYAAGLGSSTTYADAAFDDSGWSTGATMMGYNSGTSAEFNVVLGSLSNVWQRYHGTTHGGDLTITVPVVDDQIYVYLDGALIYSYTTFTDVQTTFVQPCAAGDHVFAVYGVDTASGSMHVGISILEAAG